MECTASEDEEVPDSMAEGKAPPGVEDDPDAVGEASGQKENQADLRHIQDDAFQDEDKHPAHDEIDGDHQFPEPVEVNAPDHHAGEGYAPDDAEHDPPQGSPDGGQQDRGISAGNQHENGGVVETGKELLHLFAGEAVVKG